ncbi:phosphodiesterase [Candidimonas sp. SYP-B2681]|uniref:phosphodiesterase n=1 Tax=Candidimonas sp. SYP-B2681 TaxID=2497686 RepID=UPI000F877907|nr:phosphodiesterase [Candidimonas sp. SYP-B2681]RTZ41690.1 phosphodiesterase [Candidimonas sp. SYP-B2681]
MTTSIVQLTDLHIREPGRLAYGRLDTAPYLSTAVDSVNALRQRPSAVVITGDLTDFGRAAEYRYLRQLLAPLTMPVYLLPGNHDDRDQLRKIFPEHSYLGVGSYIQYTADIDEIRLVVLDTSTTGRSEGGLCSERLDWLEDVLADSTDKPVVIAMHHPPFRTLIGHMDDIGLLTGAAELEAIVARYPNVERLICGHLHRPIEVRFGRTIASTAPSPAHQVSLDLDDAAASTWTLEPPAFRVHAWDDASGRLVTHSMPTGNFEGPYPFHEDGVLID